MAAAKAGFDEIMFDYVRFPTDGDIASAVFARRSEPRATTIARFLEYATERLEPLGVRVSAAVFGLSATRNMGIGQRPRRSARYLDAIYPMVYPSHYGAGEYNIADPNAQPGRTVALVARATSASRSAADDRLVPWLQDFSLGPRRTRSPTSGADPGRARRPDAAAFSSGTRRASTLATALAGSLDASCLPQDIPQRR